MIAHRSHGPYKLICQTQKPSSSDTRVEKYIIMLTFSSERKDNEFDGWLPIDITTAKLV
jgi:hypothetical protein